MEESRGETQATQATRCPTRVASIRASQLGRVVMCNVRHVSLATYQSHLRRIVVVEDRFPHEEASRGLEQMVLECAGLGKSESATRGVISAATMVVELRLADVVIEPTMWRAVKATTKVRQSAKECIWGSPIMLLHMGTWWRTRPLLGGQLSVSNSSSGSERQPAWRSGPLTMIACGSLTARRGKLGKRGQSPDTQSHGFHYHQE